MSTTLLTGFNIANVERVRVTTEETTPKTYMYRTMTSFDAEPYVNEGEEVTQRVKNTIMGRIKTDDLLEGYDISCEDERLIPQVLALVDGGTYDDEEQSYAAPAIGTEVVRTPFTLDLYTSDRGGDGEVKNYLQWTSRIARASPSRLPARTTSSPSRRMTSPRARATAIARSQSRSSTRCRRTRSRASAADGRDSLWRLHPLTLFSGWPRPSRRS